ncbi:hypothetical protein [Bradyrhizobium sp. dw_411]|uniref:hypothetical protein n=1 Tax=Bradyrhizobium sp. dw_411 TaxID=2720082 RepID=UPI001BCC0680|nr:hypothetical protein [Bradyrhizobium sp. dw_411]
MLELDKSTVVSESQTGSKPRPVPRRVVDRPHPSRWDEQELMNFAEAVALFWPMGPLTVHSLRTAHRSGQLGVVEIAGKFLTTKAAILEMGKCELAPKEALAKCPPTDRETAKAKAALMVQNFKTRMQDKLAK